MGIRLLLAMMIAFETVNGHVYKIKNDVAHDGGSNDESVIKRQMTFEEMGSLAELTAKNDEIPQIFRILQLYDHQSHEHPKKQASWKSFSRILG